MKPKKLPSGNWHVQVYVGKTPDGRKIRRSFTGPDRRSVMREAAAFADQHRNETSQRTVSACMDAYLRDRAAVLSPSTMRGYKSIEKKLKAEYGRFCASPAYALSSADVQAVINSVAKDHSPKTVRNYSGFISAFLTYAGYAAPMIRLPESVKPDLYIPDELTVRRLIKAVRGTDLEIPVLLAATGPLRAGEICALEMDDITGNVIHVCKSLALGPDGRWKVKPPKTLSSDRRIEMPAYVIDLIRRRGSVTDFNPRQLSRHFRTFLHDNNFPHFRFHDLRHFCVSMLKARNVPDLYIQQRGGWKTDTVMKRVYSHTLQDQSKVQTDIMIEAFDRMLPDVKSESSAHKSAHA